MGSCMAFCMVMSMVCGVYSVYLHTREVGLRKYLPKKLDDILNETSLFDIIAEVFIFRRFTKLMIRIGTPFWTAQTPEEAKYMLKTDPEIDKYTKKIIFGKVSN